MKYIFNTYHASASILRHSLLMSNINFGTVVNPKMTGGHSSVSSRIDIRKEGFIIRDVVRWKMTSEISINRNLCFHFNQEFVEEWHILNLFCYLVSNVLRLKQCSLCVHLILIYFIYIYLLCIFVTLTRIILINFF